MWTHETDFNVTDWRVCSCAHTEMVVLCVPVQMMKPPTTAIFQNHTYIFRDFNVNTMQTRSARKRKASSTQGVHHATAGIWSNIKRIQSMLANQVHATVQLPSIVIAKINTGHFCQCQCPGTLHAWIWKKSWIGW